MTGEEWALAAAVVFSGLWSGLLGMLTLVMHRMLGAMDGPGFLGSMQAFLPVGRKSWFNYACAIGIAFHLGIEASGFKIGQFSYLMVALYSLMLPRLPVSTNSRSMPWGSPHSPPATRRWCPN